MKHIPNSNTRAGGRGFTLVELLVVITIIIALAVVVVGITRGIKQRAEASRRLSDLRQAGAILLGKASELNGRCSYFAGGSGSFEFRPYIIIRTEMGITDTPNSLVEIMHWDVKKLPPDKGNEHWNCRAVNMNNVTYPDGTKTVWTQESIKDSQGRNANVKSISLASVARPESYPLLIDSSTSSGKEIFRINEGAGECVGLRSAGKADAFMFDGSARSLDKAGLKQAGFTKAYDNSTNPPKSVGL